MPLHFHKMHGAGNDFVLIDLRDSEAQFDSGRARTVANRPSGVGCDQVLVLRRSDLDDCVARYEVFNPDGSRAEQCGNGARCIGLYLTRRGEAGRSFHLEAPTATVQLRKCEDGEFEVDMGVPSFEPGDLPLDSDAPGISADPSAGHRYELTAGDKTVRVGVVSVANPHAVICVDDIESAPVADIGPVVETHAAFPEGCNVGFAQVIDPGHILLRVYERGTGETLACGSGASAAVAVLRRDERVSDSVEVVLKGGRLVIKWGGVGQNLFMKGPAAHVFRGTLDE